MIYLTAGDNYGAPGTRKALGEWLEQYSEMAVNALVCGLAFDKPLQPPGGRLWLKILRAADRQGKPRNYKALWRQLIEEAEYEASYRAFMFEIEKLKALGGIEGL